MSGPIEAPYERHFVAVVVKNEMQRNHSFFFTVDVRAHWIEEFSK